MRRGLPLFALALVLSLPCFPCSVFSYREGARAYFCGNEDWSFTDPAFRSFPARKGSYAYLLLGWMSYLPSYPQAGVNSEGLCFDWAMVPQQSYSGDPSKESLAIDFTVDALRSCKDVGEFLAYIRGKEIPNLGQEHLMVADRSGRSCVIEYAKGHVALVEGDREYQCITNFCLTNPGLGGYPCARFSKLEAFFKEGGEKSGRLGEILNAAHQDGQYPTIYSYIFDLGAMRMTLFYNHDYSRKLEYSLAELFKKAQTRSIALRN